MTIKILENKRIILGVTGGIAAYKSATVCSRLVQAGAIVDVVLTTAAQQFITPLTFQALTHRTVYTTLWDIPAGQNIPHIDLANEADLLLIAPASTNTIGKIANGLPDNLLTAIALATPAPILLAPAMETDMWQHPATQTNISRLTEWGVSLVGPAKGRLASGAIGQGRMVEPDEVVTMARVVLGRSGDLAGRRLVVSAGGTQEAIDPVRFITNRSSGKMGYAIAEAARDRGAQVTLITASPLPPPPGMEFHCAGSAAQMEQAVRAAVDDAEVLIMAAAVADFKPDHAAGQKIKKKEGQTEMALTLSRTTDILASMADWQVSRQQRLITVGFAAETENLLENAQGKMERKKLDLIVANDVSAPDAGFGVDTNRVTLLARDGSKEELPLLDKAEVAHRLLDRVVALL